MDPDRSRWWHGRRGDWLGEGSGRWGAVAGAGGRSAPVRRLVVLRLADVRPEVRVPADRRVDVAAELLREGCRGLQPGQRLPELLGLEDPELRRRRRAAASHRDV